jgi:hypothetical protein
MYSPLLAIIEICILLIHKINTQRIQAIFIPPLDREFFLILLENITTQEN